MDIRIRIRKIAKRKNANADILKKEAKDTQNVSKKVIGKNT